MEGFLHAELLHVEFLHARLLHIDGAIAHTGAD
jgi:hypothetical protein